MSKIRKQYFARLFGRIAIFIACLIMCFKSDFYNILNGVNFFSEFHILHLLWIIWMFDMILQIIPMKNNVALGSQKLWANRFKPVGEKKYYKPGKIEKVERGDDVTTFDYEEDRVIARVMRKKKPIAEIVYTLQGTPVSGRIYENGKTIRKFKYNELGQVV